LGERTSFFEVGGAAGGQHEEHTVSKNSAEQQAGPPAKNLRLPQEETPSSR